MLVIREKLKINLIKLYAYDYLFIEFDLSVWLLSPWIVSTPILKSELTMKRLIQKNLRKLNQNLQFVWVNVTRCWERLVDNVSQSDFEFTNIKTFPTLRHSVNLFVSHNHFAWSSETISIIYILLVLKLINEKINK